MPYLPPEGPSVVVGMWVVKFGTVREVFPSLDMARGYLLDELWWLAEDIGMTTPDGERVMEAWKRVIGWGVKEGGASFNIEVGNPADMYYVMTVGEEMRSES